VYTSEEGYKKKELKEIQKAIDEAKRKAHDDTIKNLLQAAKKFDAEKALDDALTAVLRTYAIDPQNGEARRIEERIRLERKKLVTKEMESARKVPRDAVVSMYRRLLKQAWGDGSLTSLEATLLQNIRGAFQISDADQKALERHVQLEVYSDALKELQHNGGSNEELAEQVQRLRKELKISEEEHSKIEKGSES
jgi:hypothetical protein